MLYENGALLAWYTGRSFSGGFMSGTITNLGHSGYYQLGNANGGQSQGAGAGSNVTQSLIQALEGQNATAASSSDAYLLSLSPQAQQYLNAVNSGAGTGQAVLNAIPAQLKPTGAAVPQCRQQRGGNGAGGAECDQRQSHVRRR
jgi:hypothetical protein